MNQQISPEKILSFFQKAYPQLKNVTIRNIQQKNEDKFQGFALFKKEAEPFLETAKARHTNVKPYGIQLNKKLQHCNYVLMHEISHCISPFVERKYKDEWIKVDHDHIFYQNLYQIVKQAYKAGFYAKDFASMAELIKFDGRV